MRAGAILACATRTTSSYDMRTARWRATSFNKAPRPPASASGHRASSAPDQVRHRPGCFFLCVRFNKAIARVAMELGSRSTLQTTTLPAMTIDDFVTSIK